MKTLLRLVIIGVLAQLSACGTALRESQIERVVVADTLVLSLPDPEDLHVRVNAMQLLSGRYEEREFDVQLLLEWRQDAIVVAALSLFGNTLFSMTYDGQEITTVGNGLVVRGLDTSYVLADMLMAFADKSLLDSNLAGEGLSIEDHPLSRIISRNGVPVIVIEYMHTSKWGGPVRFRHLERGYQYRIETVQYDLT